MRSPFACGLIGALVLLWPASGERPSRQPDHGDAPGDLSRDDQAGGWQGLLQAQPLWHGHPASRHPNNHQSGHEGAGARGPGGITMHHDSWHRHGGADPADGSGKEMPGPESVSTSRSSACTVKPPTDPKLLAQLSRIPKLHRMTSFDNIHNDPGNFTRVLSNTRPYWLQEVMSLGTDVEQWEAFQRVRNMSKTVIVGQGTSMLTHEYGSAVDRFPSIIRFNRFVLKGYEKYVGSRVTDWVLNNIDITSKNTPPAYKFVKSIDKVTILVPSRKSSKKVAAALRSLPKLKHDGGKGKPAVKIQQFGGPETAAWRRKICFRGAYFSTGLVVILKKHTAAPLAIHGFDFGKGSHGHYFQRVEADTCHDVTGEGHIMQQLERDGVVIQLACLEAKSVEEVDSLCRVTTVVPAAIAYSRSCKKGKDGKRVDVKQRVPLGHSGVHGSANLPEPLILA